MGKRFKRIKKDFLTKTVKRKEKERKKKSSTPQGVSATHCSGYNSLSCVSSKAENKESVLKIEPLCCHEEQLALNMGHGSSG